MQFADILSRFREVTEESDGGYLAACPAHGDSRPSLRIWRGSNHKVRLTCRAGCLTGDVIGKAGLEWADLFDAEGDGATVPAERPTIVGTGRVAALASYLDRAIAWLHRSDSPSGSRALDYILERFGVGDELAHDLELGADHGAETWDFPYRSAAYTRFPRIVVPLRGFDGVARAVQGRDLTGQCPLRWVSLSNPPGERWSSYGVFKGQGTFGTVIITEGPGDALSAVAVGYDAVAIRGASLVNSPELLDELAAGLRGSQVIVCGDNDTAGRGFMRKLAEGLDARGLSVLVLDVPHEGDDLTDWRARNPVAFPLALHSAVKSARPLVATVDAQDAADSAELAERTGADFVDREQGLEAARLLGQLVKKFGATNAMNAYGLVAWTDGRIKFAPGLGFYTWNGRTWDRSEVRVRQEIHRMGAALALAGETTAAKGFLNTTGIDAILTELRSVPEVYVKADEFDARPDLLSFKNGVVDLRAGKLRPHDKRDMLTVSLPLVYDAHAPAPRWEQFLSEIMPGMPTMPGYLRRLVGYGITGHVSEQCFCVLHGSGANGKSVLTDTLTEVFGPLVTTTPFATFEERRSGGIPNDLAALRGSRLVMASEGESGKAMSESVLKNLTGKDKVTARFLRQEFFTFAPTFLILLATNHKPRFKGADEGLWRRVKMVPFNRYFAPHERDYGLSDALLAEAQGIAAWAVRGAVEWYAGGLEDPAPVRNATKEYREVSDELQGFCPGVVEITGADSDRFLGNELFSEYLTWCDAENLPLVERWRRTTFYRAMEERGATKRKTNTGITFFGVRLTDQPNKGAPGIFN
ncbi:phage/plasmid primase, P4 family [Kitasatospora sp. NPDC059812]|uniref:phage/plasmid primase, P4 family n=1 Tax=Kitasatospora sp. NPDC059812 TaxID=3346958 RepID=UPI00364FD8E9